MPRLASSLSVSLAASFVALAVAACDDPLPPKTPWTRRPKEVVYERAEVELVESVPSETTLDHADVRDAKDVWPLMIGRATSTIDVEQFYVSDTGSSPVLTKVIHALDAAAARGVKIRFLVDEGFAAKYPDTLDRIKKIGAARPSGANASDAGPEPTRIWVKGIDAAKRYGGIQHAKFMIIDGQESFIGSQNFDWRALSHIQEMGLRISSANIAGGLTDIFETDWALADEGTASEARVHAHASKAPETRAKSGEALALYADPRGWLPDEDRWDLKRLVGVIDAAKQSVAVQVLTYSTKARGDATFSDLDDALRRAAKRGVQVRLLVSHWGANAGSTARRSVESLAAVPNVEARVFTIPPWSGGEIPFARVSHAKYMVADERVAWVGTSNWEGDYFYKSRNVAIVAEGGDVAPRLVRIFNDGWTSTYAKPLPGNARTTDAPKSEPDLKKD